MSLKMILAVFINALIFIFIIQPHAQWPLTTHPSLRIVMVVL